MPPNFRPDSLWHSLCPSYIQPLRSNIRVRPFSRPQCPSRHAVPPKCLRRRIHSTNAVQSPGHTQLHTPVLEIIDYKPLIADNDVDVDKSLDNLELSASNAEPKQAAERDPADNSQHEVHVVDYKPLFSLNDIEKSLGNLSHAELEQALKLDAADNSSPNADYMSQVRTVLRELVYERNIRPEARHYTALVLANVSAETGSVMNVKNILEEMENEGVKKDSGFLHAVLRALATHPDYMLRNEILTILEEHWFELRASGWHDVAVGLLRERQIELAIDKVEQMRAQNIRIEPWLYNLLVYYLCNLKEFDEVIRFLRIMIDDDVFVRPTLWYYVLDTAAQACHHPATSMAWLRRVEAGYINPPAGLCHLVLVTAARASDPILATDVIQHLSARGTKITSLDYEALMEAYTHAGDLKTALEILCIMRGIDLEPTRASTRPIHEHICHRPAKVNDAYSALQHLRTQGRDIPIAALNLIIDNTPGPDAIDIYKSIPTLCSTKPNLETFNLLFRALRDKKGAAPDRSSLMFLVAEMKALDVAPDVITYDRILLVCAHHGFWTDATLFWREMRKRDFMPRVMSVMGMLELARMDIGEAWRSSERREFIEEVEKLRGEVVIADREQEAAITTDTRLGGVADEGLPATEAVEEIRWEVEGRGRHLRWSREVCEEMSREIKEILEQERRGEAHEPGDEVVEKGTL